MGPCGVIANMRGGARAERSARKNSFAALLLLHVRFHYFVFSALVCLGWGGSSIHAQSRRPAALQRPHEPFMSVLVPQADRFPISRVSRSVSPRDQVPSAVRTDLVRGGVSLATALVAFPLDRRIARAAQQPSLQTAKGLHDASRVLDVIGMPGAYLIGGTAMVTGLVTHDKVVADIGWHGSEAMLISSATTQLVKALAGRARPFVVADSNPWDFQFGRGIRDHTRYSSFPSEHTSASFALATAVVTESARRWPRSRTRIAILSYGTATAIALSRIYDDRHWTSDVVVGAAIGATSGAATVHYSHRR